MPLVATRSLVTPDDSIAAFNVITLEHAEAIVAGAESAGRPVILQVSHNAVRFHGGRVRPIAAACAAVAAQSSTPVSLHLDHVEDAALLRQAADAGFSSAMFDPGPVPYAQNVTATAAAARWADEHGLWLEAELGYVGGKATQTVQSAHAPGVRTDPAEAARFVAETGVGALAVAVGSSHAMTRRTARLDHELIARLHAAVPVPLVLHGSSGVPDDELRAAVAAGIGKVNVGTALNVAWTSAVRAQLADPAIVDPRTYLAPARDAVAAAVAHVLTVV